LIFESGKNQDLSFEIDNNTLGVSFDNRRKHSQFKTKDFENSTKLPKLKLSNKLSQFSSI